MFIEIIAQMKKQLGQAEAWLDKAAAFAAERKFEPDRFLGFRLAPDQFAFVRQIQAACDTAKLGAARLAGQEAPKHADTEQTLDELRVRLRAVIEYLGGFTEKDLAGAAERVITTPRWEGKVMSGADYFVEHAVPNFYFHLTTAYAILRHSGVDVGKRDYLGKLSLRQP